MKLEVKSGQVTKKKRMAIKEEKPENPKSNSPPVEEKLVKLGENQLVKSVSPSPNGGQCKVSLSKRETILPANVSSIDSVSQNKLTSSASGGTSNVLTNVTSTANNNSVSSLLNLSPSSIESGKASLNLSNLNSLPNANLSNLSTGSLINASSLSASPSSKGTSGSKFSIANILSSVKGAENVLKTKSESLFANDLSPAELSALHYNNLTAAHFLNQASAFPTANNLFFPKRGLDAMFGWQPFHNGKCPLGEPVHRRVYACKLNRMMIQAMPD